VRRVKNSHVSSKTSLVLVKSVYCCQPGRGEEEERAPRVSGYGAEANVYTYTQLITKIMINSEVSCSMKNPQNS